MNVIYNLLAQNRWMASSLLMLFAALNWFMLRRMAKARKGIASVTGAFDATGTLLLANLGAQVCLALMVGFMAYLELPVSKLQVGMLALGYFSVANVALMVWLLSLDPRPARPTASQVKQ